jgi:N utilization substance protein B
MREKRSAARLAAVQALYEMEVAEAPAATVIANVLMRQPLEEQATVAAPDEAYLRALVLGVSDRRGHLDAAIARVLTPPLALDRLEVVLRALLLAGAFELMYLTETPHKVVINEYVNLAHAFFGGKEPSVINAVLDRLASDAGRGKEGRNEIGDHEPTG